MAEQFGWTLDEIDALGPEGRDRVRFMWAVRTMHRDAERFLGEWEKKSGSALRAKEHIKAGVPVQR